MTPSITTLSIQAPQMLKDIDGECRYAECRYAECRGAKSLIERNV